MLTDCGPLTTRPISRTVGDVWQQLSHFEIKADLIGWKVQMFHFFGHWLSVYIIPYQSLLVLIGLDLYIRRVLAVCPRLVGLDGSPESVLVRHVLYAPVDAVLVREAVRAVHFSRSVARLLPVLGVAVVVFKGVAVLVGLGVG